MSWSPEAWALFEQYAAVDTIQREMNVVSQQMLTAELWHRRLTALLIRRLRQVDEGTWPVASGNVGTDGEDPAGAGS